MAAYATGKSFRIERVTGLNAANDTACGSNSVDTRAILEAIESLRKAVEPAQEVMSDKARADFHRELEDAKAIQVEMASIKAAIAETKADIATLHFSGFKGRDLNRVTDELDAVVEGTEAATEEILAASEIIEDRANNLSAKLTGDDHGMANDIAEASMRIFEACNFQDITGQRITKVVQALRFIEQRIEHMLDIWGGLESFADVPRHVAGMEGEQALLNGPALEKDTGIASQDDIDALFG